MLQMSQVVEVLEVPEVLQVLQELQVTEVFPRWGGGSGPAMTKSEKSEMTRTGSDELLGIGMLPRQQIHHLDMPISAWLPIGDIWMTFGDFEKSWKIEPLRPEPQGIFMYFCTSAEGGHRSVQRAGDVVNSI